MSIFLMLSDPKIILKKIEKGELKKIPLEAGNYFVSDKGDVYSLNRTRPKRKITSQHTNGEIHVSLYVPHIRIFEVAHLVLEAFAGSPKSGQFPCYRNHQPGDVRIENLYWGSKDEREKSFAKRMLKKSILQVESIDFGGVEEFSDNYYCNRTLYADLLTLVVQMLRFANRSTTTSTDQSLISKACDLITEITSVNVLDFKKLEHLLDISFENQELQQLIKESKDVIIKKRHAYTEL